MSSKFSFPGGQQIWQTCWWRMSKGKFVFGNFTTKDTCTELSCKIISVLGKRKLSKQDLVTVENFWFRSENSEHKSHLKIIYLTTLFQKFTIELHLPFPDCMYLFQEILFARNTDNFTIVSMSKNTFPLVTNKYHLL